METNTPTRASALQSSFARYGYRLLIGLAFAVRELRRITKVDLFRLNNVRPEPFYLSPLYTAWRIATAKRLECIRRPGGPSTADTPRVLVSVTAIGELNSLRPLVNSLINSGLTVAFLVHCPTTAHLISDEFPEADIVELPVDLRRNANALLDTVKPNCILVGDLIYGSPLQLLQEARSRDIPIVLLNGVPFATPHARPARWLRAYYREFFSCYSQILTPTSEAAARFIELGVDAHRIVVAPSTKWIGSALTTRERRAADELRKLFRVAPDRPVITVASLHPGEEPLLMRLAEEARTFSPPPLVVVVPRWPATWGEMNSELVRRGIVTAHRTGLACKQYGSITPEVIFLDMIGELRATLSFSTVCVVGGTFLGKGHSPLEALRLGVPVVMGPSTRWTNGIGEAVIAKRAAIGVASMEEAADAALRLCANEAERDRLVGLAFLLLKEHHEDLDKLIELLPLPSIFAGHYDASHVPTSAVNTAPLDTPLEESQGETP